MKKKDNKGDRILNLYQSLQKFIDGSDVVSADLFRFFDIRTDIIFAFDRDYKIVYCNDSCTNLLGYKEAGLVGLQLLELVDPYERPHVEKYIEEVLYEEALYKLEASFLKKQGQVLHLKGTINCPDRNSDNPIYIAVLVDNTAEIKAEKNQHLYYQISHLSLECDNLEELLQGVHGLLKEHIFANNFLVALFEEQTKNIRFPYYVDELVGGKVDSYQRLYTKGLTEYTYNIGESVVLKEKDIAALIEKGEVELLGKQPKIWLGVPLKIGKRITGVISVKSHSDENKYNKSDLELLDFISGQIALVVERKQYEDQVNENRAHLESIFNSSQHLIWTVNRNRGLTSFNKNYADSLYKKYGVYPVVDPTGGSERLMLSASPYHDYVNDMYGKAFGGEYVHFETKMAPEDGDNVWRETFLAPIYLPDGRVEEVTGISHDVTQKKLQEIALKESEEKFRDIFESFQDVYVRADRSGNIVMVSPSVKEFAGYNPDEILGEHIDSYFFNDAKTIENIKVLIAQGQVRGFETQIVTKDGKRIPSLINMKLIPSEEGRIEEIDYVIRDITVLKEAVSELYKAKEIAEKSLEVKEIFLANMSHEIRTPMNGMMAMIDLLNDTQLNVEQRDYANTIKKSSTILLNILNDILDLSKLEAGKMELRKVPVSTLGVLDKLVSLFNQKANSKGIKLMYSVDADVPETIKTDETRLLQILSNLTSNSIKFTEEGHVKVQISLVKHEGQKLTLKFQIFDTGVGITQENIKRLFTNFNQLDNSITKQHAGTGLGLSISRALCVLMGGTIGVNSQVGEGSEFWFTIETESSDQKVIKEERPELIISENHFGADKPRVLLVDDNSVNRRVAGIILRKAGCDVTTAKNGLEAVNIVSSDSSAFDLVLMDIQMPVMDGMTATIEIKKMNLVNCPPIVAMTAYSMQDDKDKLLDAGLDHYLAKPITADSLISKVMFVLGYQSNNKDKEPVKPVDSIINEIVVAQLREIGGNEMLEEIYAEFVTEAGELISEMPDDKVTDQQVLILSNLHTIKGLSGTIGVVEVERWAKEIEVKIKAKNFEDYSKDFVNFKRAFDDFVLNYKSLMGLKA